MHEGHRQRMMEKLASGSLLQDHELLEILLFYAIPRKNTNETAHELISACGSLANVFKADVKLLCTVKGVGEATAVFLKTVGSVYERIGADGLMESSHMIFSYRDFEKYLSARYKDMQTELLELYALDAKNKIGFIQSFTTGDKDRVEISSAEVGRFLAAHRPKGLVIAHNHPDSPSAPSARDNEFTQLTHMLCSLSGVTLVDHVIVGSDKAYSYYLTGELEKIRERYDIGTMMRRANAETKT